MPNSRREVHSTLFQKIWLSRGSLFVILRFTNARREVHFTWFGKIYVPQKKSCSALAGLMKCSFSSEAVCSSFPVREKIRLNKKKPCSALAHLMKCGISSEAVRSSFLVREKIRLNKKKPCSALAHLMQCGILSEAMRSSIRCSTYDDFGVVKKQSVRFSLILKLLLNRNELERVF